VQQMFKGQDLIRQGTVGEMKWVMLNDGHGSDACINCLRSLPQDQLDKIIASSTPIESLATKIDETIKITQKDLSGATCVIARIYPSHIELISSGDSQFIVFKNRELIYVSKEHNCKSNNECERLAKRGFTFKPSTNIKVLSETTITTTPAGYAVFPKKSLFENDKMLACTQALGHNSLTGYNPEVYSFPFVLGETYRVVLGSDGLYDMTMMDDAQDIQYLCTKTSQEICDKAVNRWRQEWEAHLPDKNPQKIQFDRDNHDDVSVAVLDIASLMPV
jgi:serine/threonine protein phosphatase PrpC